MATKVRRSSAEIVAVTTELRHRQESRKRGKKKGGKEDPDDAKRELDIDDHKKSVAELCADLQTNAIAGMNSTDADARREVDGPNRLTPPKQTPEIVKLFREMTGFFSLLLWVASILCFICYGLVGGAPNIYLGIVLACVVVITGTFSYVQNRKSSNLMESFKNMMPTITQVVRDGTTKSIDASLLVRGDVILIKAGDKVPADFRVLEGSDDLTVDNSSLTGEPEPLKRIVDCTHENPLETKNLCFFGTFIPSGSGRGVVIRTGDRTVMGRIAKLATSTKKEETPIAREINHFVHVITGVAVFIAIVFLIIRFILGATVIDNIVFMISIIVANVPEGLLATLTVCLSLAASRMASKNVLVKNLEGVETLGSTSCICSDKTGTLTQNIMTVANIVYDSQIWDAECSITPTPTYKIAHPSFQRLQRCATLCNNAVFDEESKFEQIVKGTGSSIETVRGAPIPFSDIVTSKDGTKCPRVLWQPLGDASESAMIKFCQDKRDIIEYRNKNQKIKEVPFNSRNKYQLSIHKQENDESKPMLLVMKGAPERILSRCNKILLNGEIVDMTPERLAEVEACQLALSKKGMRVLGFADLDLDLTAYPHGYTFDTDNCNFPLGEKDVDYEMTPTPNKRVEEPLCFIGLMALIDPPRPEVPMAVAKCKSAGIRVIMVTGDHPITAKAIAHKVGILWGPTKEDIEEENAENKLQQGDPGWKNPDLAPAIVVPGWTISVDTPEEEWDRILDHPQCVFARTSPQQKLIIVENCQRRGEIVAVTGDGVNDSPALKKADIGIAMGIMGSEVSKEAADMILLDDNFASIVSGVEEGRKVFDNLKKSICYALAVNIPELIPFLTYMLILIPCPLTTILMLLICLGTDLIPAIAIAYEEAENDIMLRSPRVPSVDRLVTKKLIYVAYCHIGMMEAFAGHVVFFIVLNDYGYSPTVLPGLGQMDNFGKQVLWCKTSGGEFCSPGGYFMDAANGEAKTPIGKSAVPVCSSSYNDTIPSGGSVLDAQIWWRPSSNGGSIDDCVFPFANYVGTDENEPAGFDHFNPATYGKYTGKTAVITVQSQNVAWEAGYRPYYPYAARRSAFWKKDFFTWDPENGEVDGLGSGLANSGIFQFQPIGVWSITNTETQDGSVTTIGRASTAFNGKSAATTAAVAPFEETATKVTLQDKSVFKNAVATWKVTMSDKSEYCTGRQCLLDYRAGFTLREGGKTLLNVMSRRLAMMALTHAQTAYFVGIVVMQWANVINCKTRLLSIRSQGMRNSVLLFGLGFEFFLCAATCYSSFFQTIFGTTGIRLTHWFPAMPVAMFMFLYDEIRKYLLRSTSTPYIDKVTGKSVRVPGWVERNTYY